MKWETRAKIGEGFILLAAGFMFIAFLATLVASCDSHPPTIFLTTTTTEFKITTTSTVSELQERALVLHPSRSKTSLTTRTTHAQTKPSITTTTTTIAIVKQTTTTQLASGYGDTSSEIPPRLRRIGGCESSGRPDGPLIWDAYNAFSGASGAFQYLRSTWNRYRGYLEARLAPAAIQIERALSDFKRSTSPWASSRGCWN